MIINQLYERFNGVIRSTNYHRIVKQHKWNFIPLA
jgi:hypothetical protein